MHIDITNTCNLDCITCWNYAPGLPHPKNADWKNQRMAPSVFFRILDEIASCSVDRIILSGAGEPFTHPDIDAFICAVKSRGLSLTVITNGTLCDFSRLAELAVDQLLINTSSACAATYTTYHPNQTAETFEALIAGVTSLAGSVAVNLVQVINALNAGELTAMIELASRTHSRASFKLGDTPPGTECCRLSDAEIKTLLERDIPEAIARAKILGVKHNLPAFALQLASSNPERASLPCFAGYLYSRIYVDGRVFFCCEHIEVGRIEEADFQTLWNGTAYNAVRQSLHEGHRFPGCARCGKHDMNYVAARQLAALSAENAT